MNTEKTTPQKLTPTDKTYVWIVAVVACFIAAFGAYSGHLLVMVAGIVLAPIAYIIRFPRRAK